MKLQKLEIEWNFALSSLEGLPELPSLQELEIVGNFALSSLEGLPELPSLQKLEIVANFALSSLEGLPELPSLQELIIGWNNFSSLKGLPVKLNNLKIVMLYDNPKLISIDCLSRFQKIEEFNVENNRFTPKFKKQLKEFCEKNNITLKGIG